MDENETTSVEEISKNGSEQTGLPWPKSWRGAYLFVIGSFIIWLTLLITLTEFFS